MRRLGMTLAVTLFTGAALCAGSIPAWLDDGITHWNKENPASPLQFVDVKDSYVWYTLSGTTELESKAIRDRVYSIVYKNGYANSQDEEIVTTAKPPSPNGPAKAKKCWTRSFLRDIQKGSATTEERMLTTLVCDDAPGWSAGFRVLQ